MERFVIGAAILAAVAIAAGGYFGHAISDGDGFRFVINGESEAGGSVTKGGGAPSNVPAAAYAGRELKVRNAVARLTVIPEDRSDIALEIVNPGTLPTPTVRLEGDEVVVDGGIANRRIRNCEGAGDQFTVTVNGVGDVSAAQAPRITARVPRAVAVAVSGGVESEIGPSSSADLLFSGCGDARVGDVAGDLDVSASGSGDLKVGAAQSASVSMSGSGAAVVGAVAQKLDVSLSGSGGVTVAAANGPVEVAIAGSGDVAIDGGSMGDADVSIAGSGGVTLGGDVQSLDVSIAGSGDVEVRGKAAALDASIMGSGDVTVAAVSGRVEKAVMGSGKVQVGP
ncbi:MAG: DUF2807 domain-containing protein [Hyphomonadaceae bacterium]|nr:DUF2807 domain-containing protein [Hyphomonadaceae bacterium]